MDQQEYTHRTQIVREQLGNDELFREIEGAVRQDDRVLAMAERIKSLRLSGDHGAEAELVAQNRDVVDAVRTEELHKRGFGIDIEKLEEEAEARRKQEVATIRESLRGDETEAELLRVFRLTDENGVLTEKSLDSPLFTERTKMAFHAYRTSVTAHEAFVDYNRLFGIQTRNLDRADEMRTEAHDTIARDVAEDLDLEFDTARKLVAKMRDGIAPGSGEEEAYARSILRVGKRLAKRYGDDAAGAVGEALRPVLGSDSGEQGEELRQN